MWQCTDVHVFVYVLACCKIYHSFVHNTDELISVRWPFLQKCGIIIEINFPITYYRLWKLLTLLIAGYASEHTNVIASLPKLIPYHFLIDTLMLLCTYNCHIIMVLTDNHMYLHTVYMKIFAGERKFHQAQLPLYCRKIYWKKFSPMQ